MKNPLELAEEHCINTSGFVSKQDSGNFLAGYEAAEARMVSLIKEELQVVESQQAESPAHGLALSSVRDVLETLLQNIQRT